MKVDSLAVELVLVPAEPHPLEGAWFAGRDSDTGALVLHGKGGNFYSGVSRFVAAAIAGAGFSALALNMRCHDLGYSHPYLESPGLLRHPVDGGMWEQIASGHRDLAAAVAFIRGRGCRRIVLVGHSSGGFYAADFADRDPEIAGFVFLSPLLTNRTAIPGWFPSADQQAEVAARARAMVAEGKGDNLIPLDLWYKAISARALLERMDEPAGRFEQAMQATRAPVLMLVGGRESRVEDWRAMTGRLPSPTRTFQVIEGSEHNYIGYEDQAAGAITTFLARHVAAADH